MDTKKNEGRKGEMKGRMKKGEVPSKTAAMLITFIICGAAILFLFLAFYSDLGMEPGFAPTVIYFGGNTGECASGERLACTTYEGCAGEKACMHGSWSGCRKIEECTPGEERLCPTHTCTSGIQTCNECGQWGRCMLP